MRHGATVGGPRSSTLDPMATPALRSRALGAIAIIGIVATSTTAPATATPTTGTGATPTAPSTTRGTTTPSTTRGTTGPQGPEPVAWIVADAGTGAVLAEHNSHTPERPASTTKIMTALAALERLKPDTVIPISANAVAHNTQDREPSGMVVGQTWPLDLTLGTMMVISSNEAAYALAEATAGTIAKFADDETITARRLGLRDSTFNDPAGLDDRTSFGGGPMMSPYDIAITVRNGLTVPELAQWAARQHFVYTDPGGTVHDVQNHNKMLAGGARPYVGANGFKTGFTSRAGNTLASSATRNGRTLIAVVMQTADPVGWSAKLLDDGFARPLGYAGTGESLPPVRITTYRQRSALQSGFVALATARPTAIGVATPTTAASGSVPAASSRTSAAAPTTKAAHGTAASTSGGSSSGLLKGFVFIVALLGVLVVLRRRAVRRRRAKRRAQRQRTEAALRRGSLPVVDGRYRSGTRTGPPVQSNVRVRRFDD